MGSALPISLCMIVKNEEAFLDVALKSVKSVLGFRDIVVVDTGSNDRTKEIASENGARVLDFKWCDDFSAARNFSADNAVNDWVLVLDADEEVMGVETGDLAEFINDDHVVGTITMVEMFNKSTSPGARLYNRKTHRYEGSIHEQIVPVDQRSKIVRDAPILIVHHGYLPDFGKVQGKLERNERLLILELDKHPDDPYLLYQLGKSYFCDNRDLPKACEIFEKALTSDLDVRLGYVYNLVECYGYALLNTGQYDKALKLMERFAQDYNKVPQFRFLSAHILQNNGLLIEAVEFYESCIGADTVDYSGITSFLSYYNIGVILECVGMLEDAIQMYENCGEYKPALSRLDELSPK